MTSETIGPGVRRLREALAQGERPDSADLIREYPDEASAITDEMRNVSVRDSLARERGWLIRARVLGGAGEDVTLGTTVRDERTERGLTPEALAQAVRGRGASLSPADLADIEANRVANVQPAVWAALLEELGLDRHEVVAGVRLALAAEQLPELDVEAHLERLRGELGIPTESTHGESATPPDPTTAEVPVVSPAAGLEDALDVQTHIDRIFGAAADGRAAAIRQLFVETLDFNPDRGQVDLREAPDRVELPDGAERIAELEGVHVVYVALEAPAIGRVRKEDVTEAARLIERQLGEDLLLVVANAAGDQLHLVLPDLTGTRPMLRRLVFERGEHNRTPVEQVSKIYRGPRDTRSVRVALTEAFDVEPVTKRFFQEYYRVFRQAEKSVSGFADDEGADRRLFVQTLFNRLMFIYFLQRKGWLDFRGDKDYLRALWDDYSRNRRETDNFHLSRLTTLFFVGLNNPDSRDLAAGTEPLIGNVPFLNGGLFEQGDLDKRKGVTVPDEAIEPVLTDLFERFNFTVMESTPFDIEVAVDPEMLGKVFEELVNDRHDSGTYYTPRPVVSFMCREALKGYLEGMTGLGTEPIRALVDEHDVSGISLASAQAVAGALDEVTVVDPACGSGAYLLGMMQELVELWTILYSDRLKTDDRSHYDLKLHIIERNLYGVDIDQFAVNIAMLRMWLSLAIEYEGAPPIRPLPNLDFKIVRGDSLLAPDPSAGVAAREAASAQMMLGRDPERMEELDALKGEYMRETNPERKASLEVDINGIRDPLREGIEAAPAGSLDWRIEFAEVFAHGGGFDIVLANPPYRVIKGDQLRAMYRDGVFGRMNTYGLFIQRSLQLLCDGGRLSFINPRTLLTDRYFTHLRKLIRQSCELKGVVLIADRHNTFERVLQECIVLHLERAAAPRRTYSVETRAIAVPEDLNDRRTAFSVDSNRVLLGDAYGGAFYIGPSEFDYDVFERMDATGVRLDSFGLKAETGKIQFDKFREYALPHDADGAARLIWAENVQRYATRPSRKRVGKEYLSSRIVSVVPPSIVGRGIVTQRVSANEQPRRIIATALRPASGLTRAYSENHTNFIAMHAGLDEAHVLAALNSSLMEFVFRRLNSNTQVSAGEINALPFPPEADSATSGRIRELVGKLLDAGGVDAEPSRAEDLIDVEQRLDILIGSLYGFSAEVVREVQQQLPSYREVYGAS